MPSPPPDCAPSVPPTTVGVVMPAYNAAHLLPRTLTALLEAAEGARVVVVDPGSNDGTAEVARELGAEVIVMDHRAGPAEARNVGVAELDTDVVLFVDSDCVAHRDIVERVRAAFADDAELVSLTGSYDDEPPEPGFFSQYMNLRHHHTHQIARQDGASFWAGCGAVRLDVYRDVGGYDAVQFPMPMIEDIELGMRLRPHGRTRLDPDLQVTHLKRWTMTSVIGTDIFKRAVPWSRLLHAGGGMPNDLNLRHTQRIAAALSAPALISVIATPVLAFTYPLWALLPAAIVAASVALNLELVRCFARCRGWLFGACGWAFHQVHLFYSAVTFVLVGVESRLRPTRSPSS